ncbi:MAG: DUF4129 domain-containing protein [Anaerolineae bacterium]|nr:DUF4129 domain-containing protein [Anaerolineae bacterium]
MVNIWGNDPSSRIKLRESDDYLGKTDDPLPGPQTSPWISRFLHPLIVGIMVACIAQSLVKLIHQNAPGWQHALFIIAPIYTSFAGYATFQRIQNRFASGTESLRIQVFELVVIFILCKISTHLNLTIPALRLAAQQWFTDPLSFFDSQTILLFLISMAAWLASSATANDMYRISDPTLYVGEKSPLQRITNRFFTGGLIIIVVTAFASVNIADVITTNRSRVSGLIGNMLIYFMLGLFILGQINFTHHTGVWRLQRVRINTGLRLVWLRYSLIFLGIVTLIAFVLPTGYTVGLLDIVGYMINLFFFIANFIIFLLSVPFLLLIALLFPNRQSEVLVPETPVQVQPPQPSLPPAQNPWYEILRSVIFWALALVAIGYVLRGYFRDHPHIFAFLRNIHVRQWIKELIYAIRSFWDKLVVNIEKTMPRVIERIRQRRNRNDIKRLRKSGTGIRERVFHAYLSTLDIAQELGMGRKAAQTPYEYNKDLEPKLEDTAVKMTQLTEFFVKARYSKQPIHTSIVDTASETAKIIQDKLRTLRKGSIDASEDTKDTAS